MKYWKISFQYLAIVFATEEHPTSDRPYILMDDSNIEYCLSCLTEQHRDVWVYCRQGMHQVIQYMMSHYLYIKAAGGIVENAHGQRLLILRNDHWDMAKGKVEPGETLHAAALREVQEETGLHVSITNGLPIKCYHIYDLYGGWHLKQTSWFAMAYDGTETPVPQAEEGITRVEWVSPQLWRKRLAESYSMLRTVCEQVQV